MSTQQEGAVLSRYFVIKTHQWRGNLRRILVIGRQNVSTHDVPDYKLTNSYNCSEIRDFFPITSEEDQNTVTTGAEQLFTIFFPNAKMKFKSRYRSDILTDLFKVCTNYSPKYAENTKKYTCLKHRWSGDTVKVILDVGVYAVNKVNAATGQIVATYYYKDIFKLLIVKDNESGPAFVISTTENEKYHLFIASDENVRREILDRIRLLARKNIGTVIPVSNETLSLQQFSTNRLGIDVSSIIPLHFFLVFKVGLEHKGSPPKKRFLALTDQFLLERDANTNEIVNLRFLIEVYAIVRPKSDSQLFAIHYLNGDVRFYTSTERDILLASLLDSVRTSGNANVHVKLELNHHKIISHPEIETVRYLQLRNRDLPVPQALDFFIQNSFVTSTSINNELKNYRKETDKYIQVAISELLMDDFNDASDEDFNNQLLALRHLFCTKAGFAFFVSDRKWKDREIEFLFIKMKKALNRENDVIIFTAIDMLSTLMQPYYDENDLYYEQKNKGFLLSSEKFLPLLLDLINHHVTKGTGALIISAILEFLIYALCAPYSETTDGGHFDLILNLVAKSGRSLFKLFNHKSFSIVKSTCLLMKAIIEEGTPTVASHMQELSLAEGTFLFHLHSSLYPIVSGDKFLPIQILSRKLLSLWTVSNDKALDLLNCIFPLGLLNFLESKEKPPKDSMNMILSRDNLKIAQDLSNKSVSHIQKLRDNYPAVRMLERQIEDVFHHWRKRIGLNTAIEVTEDKQPVVLRRRREVVKSNLNWNMFFYQFTQNHALPDLIWNHKTREELRESVEKEIYQFNSAKELHAAQLISWNFTEFEVHYISLADEIKIGNYYLRLLLSQENASGSEANTINRIYIKNSYDFFNNLYHRFLSNSKLQMKSDCLQAMSIIYGEYFEEIGPFNDVNFMIKILEECVNRVLRDRLVQFTEKLIKNKTNIKNLIDSDGISILIDLATLSHLHVNRAVIHNQSNVIEASPEMMKGSMEKEWHIAESNNDTLSYSDLKDLWNEEKINADTKCWAQGYNTWIKICQVSQLKWTLVAEGNSIFHENDMTILILNVLIKICEAYPSRGPDDSIIRPLPKVKQILTHDSCLPHLVHLLLTFDPVIVEKIATLVNLVMQDNPRVSLLYQTGLFYFILMYTGSNIHPISRLLHYTHLKQSFKSEDTNQTVLQRSILGQMLPEAMVCYLENYGPEEFSKVFLGEFDTPEVIWNYEMRRFMIERIAAHIVDFSPRLQSNVRAIYQYCPIPPIRYSQLESELFCNIYYLKNLCDTKRFNDWKIKEPVTLLKNILEIWKVEIEKKPNTMLLEDAMDILGIKDYDGQLSGPPFESLIRKRYYQQAQLYHPDKNPNGREMFEKVNEAYFFLCSGNHKSSGPDPQNIILILKTQSILFSRHGRELHQYKYAGYPMLLKTLELEIDDQYLFSKTNPLLAHACKTVYHSVRCSALNAEELRRNNGLEILYNILNRCVSVLSASSKPNDLATKVCKYIVSCFGVSAEFSACRRYFYDMSLLPKNIFYILNYKHLIKLCISAIDCIIYFCNDPYLQLLLFKAGIVFSLLQFIFKYDYTLEEADVEADDKTNRQCLSNSLAKKSLATCVALFENKFVNAQVEDKSLLDDYSAIRQALFALLTPYIANQLTLENVPELLKMLNSNVENPYFIWNNHSRAELVNYLQEQEKELLRSGVCMDTSFGAQFEFSSHKEELIIGDIFVRIYNTQPNFPLADVKKFVIALLDHLGSIAQYLHAIKAVSFPSEADVVIDETRLVTIKQCFMALINLIKHNPRIETYFVGNFKNIFSFLRLDTHPEIQSLVLELIMNLSTNKECLIDISNSGVIIYLLLICNVSAKITESKSKIYLDVLSILMSFTSNSDLVKEGISKGVLLYALYLFIGSHFHVVREQAAQLMIKLCSDKLSGQYSKWVLSQFLPELFLNAMKDAAQNAITLYDENQENPELIWTDESRNNLNGHLKNLIEKLYATQVSNPASTWKFNADCELKLTYDSGEFKIAGVYLHLYNQSPGWILSRPKDFLLGLLEYMKEFMEKPALDEKRMDLVTTSVCTLFLSQPTLLLLIPPTGYIQIFVNKLRTKNAVIAKASLSVIAKFSLEPACVSDMIATNVLAENLNYVLENHEELNELVCDVLIKIFESNNNDFVTQAINCDLIKHLLHILDSNANQSAKAKVVQMLQCIQTNPILGPQIAEILAKSNVWHEYKDQKHDLFITHNNTTQYLTGPNVNIAGYLTQNAANTLPLVPPPIDE